MNIYTKAIIAICLILATVCTKPIEALAEETKERKSVGLGTQGVCNPASDGNGKDGWQGDYMYFGTYGKDTAFQPIRFRILSSSTEEYGSNTMLLDCDNVLLHKAFNSWGYTSESEAADWEVCELRGWLNGDGFLLSPSVFSDVEREAIAVSVKEAGKENYDICQKQNTQAEEYQNIQYFDDGRAALNEKIFLLSGKEASSPAYGYTNPAALIKTDLNAGTATNAEAASQSTWWFRSNAAIATVKYDSQGRKQRSSVRTDWPCGVTDDGMIDSAPPDTGYVGVSPALNIKNASVLYISDAAEEAGDFGIVPDYDGNEWKMTLLDGNDGFSAILPDKAVAGETVSITVSDLGSGAFTESGLGGQKCRYSQISAMLVDMEGNVEAYGKISDAVSSGEIHFTLPQQIKKGKYCLGIFAEQPNGRKASGYASNMVTGGIVVSPPCYTVKKGDTLWGIAQAYETTVEALAALNPDILDVDLIYPGQEIVTG